MKEEWGNIYLENRCRVKQSLSILTYALEHSCLDTLSLRMVLKGSVPRGFAKVCMAGEEGKNVETHLYSKANVHSKDHSSMSKKAFLPGVTV